MSETTGGNYNTAIGYQAMYLDNGMANIHNTFVGQGIASGNWANNPCTHNTGLGSGVMQGNMDGALGNTALGVDSLNALTSGDYNTAQGFNAGASLNTGGYNVLIGYNSGDALTSSAGNVFVGISAGSACTDTANAVLIGNGAGEDSDIASDGTIAIGYQALKPLTSGTRNLAIGYQSGGFTNSGSDNTLIGYRSGSQGDTYGLTTGGRNVALGSHAFGGSASAHITGSNNTALGPEALLNAQETVADNTAVGQNALYALTTGSSNVAIGSEALETVTTGKMSVAVGYQALHSQTHPADGTNNSRNTMVGTQCGDDVTSGKNNTGIGAECAFDIDADNQTALGYQATTDSANDIAIGNTSVDEVKGQVDFSTFSDKRIKTDIKNTDVGLEFINLLKPRKFKKVNPAEYPSSIKKKTDGVSGEWTDAQANKVWDGLIAQEVKEAMDSCNVTFSGWNEEKNSKQLITYSTMVMPLIKAVQELSAKVTELESKLK